MTDIKEPINTTSDGIFLSVVCENIQKSVVGQKLGGHSPPPPPPPPLPTPRNYPLNTNLVEIELSSLCLPWSLYLVPLLQCQKTTLVQRSAETTYFSVQQKLLQLLNGEMSWKENSSLLRLWPYQGMKHTVSQNSEFIARYC